MFSDPSTLVQVTIGICLMSALAYGAGVRTLGFHREAGRDWAWANVFFAASLGVVILRAEWPQVLLYTAGDAASLVGFAFMRSGFERFLGRPSTRREHLWLVGGATLAIGAAYGLQWPVLRLVILCGAAAWLFWRAAITAFRGLREEFSAGASLLVAGPLFLGAALELLRGLGGLFDRAAHATDAVHPSLFNVLLLWAALNWK